MSDPEPAQRQSKRRHSVFDRLTGALLSLLFIALLLLATAQLLWRLSPASAPLWIGSLIGAVVLWLIMIGAVQATGRMTHARVQVLECWLPSIVAGVLRRVALALTALICLVLASSSMHMVLLEYEFLGRSFPSLPAWGVLAIVPVGFVTMGLRFLIRAVAADS